MTELEWTDRYSALGIPQPDPETMCLGECEGTGIYPLPPEEPLPAGAVRIEGEDSLGWSWVRCERCGGTGKRAEARGRAEG